MSDLVYSSATKLAEMIRNKEASSKEVIDAHLDRIDAVNPRLNAVVQLSGEAARKQALFADEGVSRGDILGPLHGVPVTIKDSLETEGVISTAGTLGRADFMPDADAAVVARLRSAGAIVLGKTNVPELSMVGETDNLVYGRTNNPYDLARTPGGSSGGEAAIIAAGGSPLGIGGDIGGSIRQPAHFCGIAGIKPSQGRVPRTGHFPPPAGALGTRLHIGPMARYVEDLVLALPIIAGPDWRDPAVVPMPLGDPAAVDVRALRLAFYTDNGIVTPSLETTETVSAAVQAVANSAMSAEETCPDAMKVSDEIARHLDQAERATVEEWMLEMAGTREIHPMTKRILEHKNPKESPAARFRRVERQWEAFRSEMLSFMEDYDVIICPVMPGPAWPHGTTSNADDPPDHSYTDTYSLTGWPAVAVRAGTSAEGLPIGVQVVGAPWRDDVALAVAQHIEAASGGWIRPEL